ncbi:MAG TPA: hypothetical protein VMC84_08060 [Methanocella sp.]|uniref:hypothetical protein n=1 Tax=Methanocella sp. TaxID=2052833 RepID=UPI002CED5BBA|nr:hypothetical protein [Methanocella sp.]HTY91113.1 hypothetical protein [Methanocella sp.]
MKHVELSYWPFRSMSILILIMGLTVLNEQTNGPLSLINTDPLIYGILAIGVGLIIVIWFMYETQVSYNP